MEITVWCIAILAYIAITVEGAHRLAIAKNRDPEMWRVMAFALGIFPIIALLILPKPTTAPVSVASQTGMGPKAAPTPI